MAESGCLVFFQVKLGNMYLKGHGGLTRSDEEAANWYWKAAEQGFALGQVNLGNMYERGGGGLIGVLGPGIAQYKFKATYACNPPPCPSGPKWSARMSTGVPRRID